MKGNVERKELLIKEGREESKDAAKDDSRKKGVANGLTKESN